MSERSRSASRLPPLALLPTLRTTTPSEEGGRVDADPLWISGGRRGGPCIGGPTTPPRGPKGPRRRGIGSARSTAFVSTTLVLLLLAALFSLAAGVKAEGPGVAAGPSDGSNLTLAVQLAFHNASSNQTVPVAQTLGAVIFFNGSDLEPFDNFTLQNHGNYTLSDFSGENLTGISTVLVDAYPPPSCPRCPSQQAEDDYASQGGTFAVNLTFSSPPSGSLPPPSGSVPTAGDPFPVFLQLVAVGVFGAIAYLLLTGGRKVLAPVTAED
jgi:hypothetical protein